MLVGNTYNLLLDSRGRNLGNTKQAIMEKRMKELEKVAQQESKRYAKMEMDIEDISKRLDKLEKSKEEGKEETRGVKRPGGTVSGEEQRSKAVKPMMSTPMWGKMLNKTVNWPPVSARLH